MTYEAPDARDLKDRFPEFNSASDTLVCAIIEEAAAQVGDTWVERDRKPATLYLAAHMLAMEGEPGRSATGQGIAATGPVRRRKVGDVETEYAGYGASEYGRSGYGASEYGRRFAELMRRNFPAIAVV